MNVKFAKRAAMAASIAAVSVAMVAGTAHADPTEVRELAGVGSDTTQDVMNGVGAVVADPNHLPANLLIASYNATGTTPINTRGTTQCSIPRPDGSGAGVAALRSDITAGTHCLDFARSSSAPNATGQFTFIPFAVDAVAPAVRTGSTIGANIVAADLVHAYNCQSTTGATLPVGTYPTLNGVTVHPLIPQAGSGTRKFWASKMGISATTLPWCVSDVAKDGTQVQEHDGSSLQRTVAADGAEDVVPFSIAQWIAQSNSIAGVTDRRHGAVLESVGSVAPRNADGTLNTSFPYNREVYNVVQTTRLGEADLKLAFVGSTSKTCTAKYAGTTTTVINKYGFGTDANCGVTTTTGDLV